MLQYSPIQRFFVKQANKKTMFEYVLKPLTGTV